MVKNYKTIKINSVIPISDTLIKQNLATAVKKTHIYLYWSETFFVYIIKSQYSNLF